jgi:hypothetical protein
VACWSWKLFRWWKKPKLPSELIKLCKRIELSAEYFEAIDHSLPEDEACAEDARQMLAIIRRGEKENWKDWYELSSIELQFRDRYEKLHDGILRPGEAISFDEQMSPSKGWEEWVGSLENRET